MGDVKIGSKVVDNIENVATEPKQDDIIDILNRVGKDDALIEFRNDAGSAEMNVNIGFSGTPEGVNDGGDTTLWTPTNLTGSNFAFTSTTHAKQGIATVVDFNNLSGDAVTIDGTNITNTTLTEGVDWTAATSNTATATSLASAINGVAGVSATASGAVVTVIADDATVAADITTFTSTDGTNLPVSAQSVDGSSTVNGDEALFTAPAPIDFDNFSTLTLDGFIIDWSSEGGNKEVELRFRLAGTNIGNSVNLSKFIEIGTFNVWQSLAMGKSEFGITGQTVDELVIKVVDVGAGSPPSVSFDRIQVEEQGTPDIFKTDLEAGSIVNVKNVFLYGEKRGGINGADGFPDVDPAEFFFINELAVGLVNSVKISGVEVEGGPLRSNGDLTTISGIIESRMFKNSNGGIVWHFNFREGAELTESAGDFISFTVNDDLSGLFKLRAGATGDLSFE